MQQYKTGASPNGHHHSLGTNQYAQYRTRHPIPQPPPKQIRIWMVCLAVILIGAAATLLKPHSPAIISHTISNVDNGKSAEVAAPTRIPRAQPVEGPLTSTGEPMLSGSQYYVTMPDGRRLLVNYKGWIDHAFNLPRQPAGGANNAAYTEKATGLTWIWTLPLDSNTPKWLDP